MDFRLVTLVECARSALVGSDLYSDKITVASLVYSDLI
jgi:hypothetical protein